MNKRKTLKERPTQTFINDCNIFIKKTSLEFLDLVSNKTPEDTGGTRHNWHISIDSPRVEIFEGTGDPMQREIPNVMGFNIRHNQKVFITNNYPNINMIEYGGWKAPDYPNAGKSANSKVTTDGYSKKSPAGMVRLSIKEITPIIKKIAGIIYSRRGYGGSN